MNFIEMFKIINSNTDYLLSFLLKNILFIYVGFYFKKEFYAGFILDKVGLGIPFLTKLTICGK